MKLFYLEFIFLFCLLDTSSSQIKLSFEIPGPRSFNDSVAIVGAGASGIHMALLLKEKGFKNVFILEKENYIGGKSWTYNYHVTPHELGAVYLAPDYRDNVIKLVDKYAPGDLVPLQPASVWLDELNCPSSYKQYLISYATEHFNVTNKTEAGIKIRDAVVRYITFHESTFGEYEGEIMPEPTPEVLFKLRGTFLECLRRNNLEAIAPILFASSVVQGYGRLDEIACLYGMMWNTPELMKGLLARLKEETNETGLYLLKRGFTNLWGEIVRREKLRVTKNVHIYKMYRSKNDNYKSIFIEMKVGKQGKIELKNFDFLIWSPEMKTSLKYWFNPEIIAERFYFSRTKPTFFTTALVNSKGTVKGPTPIDYWFDNINKKRENSLWAQRDSFAAINGGYSEKFTPNKCHSASHEKPTRTTVTYQMSDKHPFYLELKSVLFGSLTEIGARDIDIVAMKTWRYFPRYSQEDMEKGYIWRILEMQGKYGMWYIGSSVCFESVKSVLEYNKLLLKNMMLPTV